MSLFKDRVQRRKLKKNGSEKIKFLWRSGTTAQ